MVRTPALAASVAAVSLIAACTATKADAPGRLASRPHAIGRQCAAGNYDLHVAAERDAVLYVPASAAQHAHAPLLVVLHGATGEATRAVHRLEPAADASGVILVAPSSRGVTWDAIRGSLGADVGVIDLSLKTAFQRCDIDPNRVGVAGFSDGASYALTLGLINGDLFNRVIAFSPCLVAEGIEPRGHPEFFISHGTRDEILPFEQCGHTLVRALRAANYRVQFEQFDGGHQVPPAIAVKAFEWFSGSR